ncbi:DUF389 domain-containing protein [Marinirhabdus gelatinilytica]|uniref:Putative hydrophobic protein (TIGR00271 family) n=1 Tax=Marinirhabdus gelatinilytica TaxID=1703343 RepID=A0A370Q7C3_9FLAO|nr:DUF389 domain-containing protein [Marinirhabdus gelatinilytica]RDK84285.1 putative hydrophobic protein (TIGR00271 family) [Marinirhabdus gelatinilytica]
MSTPEDKNYVTPSEAELEKDKKKAWDGIRAFLKGLFNLHDDTDRDATIEAVRKDIPFRGHTAWILIFSIFVASIGLNVSSTAVVIGAMLISPLMGPIVGVGLSVAINDVETLRKSLVNLGVMVGLSVLTAFFYFSISPLTEETPELVARTYPTILDVLVAVFGGLALIVAKTKSGTIASVIFGVAIATALMPPLCTVGYGLAIGNLDYAGGALYLFSINAVFIALSTFIVAKILRFPMVRYANSKRRKFIARMASLIAIIVIVPSVYLFYKLLQEQVFENKTKDFVKEIIRYEGAEVVKFTQDYKTRNIEVYLIGNPVPQPKINEWITALNETEELEGCNLRIYQGSDRSGELAAQISGDLKNDILSELYANNQQTIRDKDERIEFLENEIAKLRVKDDFPFENISKELKVTFDGLEDFSYSRRVTTNFEKTDTLAVFSVSWDKNIRTRERTEQMKKMGDLLKVRLDLDTLAVEERSK